MGRREYLRVAGLEPARPCDRQILSLLRLPFRHTRVVTGLFMPRPAGDQPPVRRPIRGGNILADGDRQCLVGDRPYPAEPSSSGRDRGLAGGAMAFPSSIRCG